MKLVKKTELKKAKEATRKVTRSPEASKRVKAQLYSKGVIVRFADGTIKGGSTGSWFKMTSLREKPADAAYRNAVAALYSADNVDTEKAQKTVRREVSAKELAFYSQFSPVK
jgi:hypothetical protein